MFWSTETIETVLQENDDDFDLWTKNYLSVNYEDQFIEVIEYWTEESLTIMFN